ncbi:MAG: DUF1501 domain-containing protein [Pseudomonadota bacterium]|nr:DUF1501 domain-containing protein [Pseudomonadota bacterium]
MKKPLDFERMPITERRQFLKILGLVLASPFVPPALRFGCLDIVMGEAYAQSFESTIPTNFIEINLRDQFDFLNAIVAPGLATYPNLRRGFTGRNVALSQDPNTLRRGGNNFYLGTDGLSLIPHLDSIAVIEVGELSMGTIHGHEAANALRSPGRNYNAGAGRTSMWNIDGQFSPAIQAGDFGGNERHYSATPTSAILHNFHQRQLDRNLRRGIAYKGLGRGDRKHAIYHHAANLVDAQIDRITDTPTLLSNFANVTSATSILAQQKDLVTRLLNRVDASFLNRLKYTDLASSDHLTQIQNFNSKLARPTTALNLNLTALERQYWSSGVPDVGFTTFGGSVASIWEQAAYAAKLVSAAALRTVALEFCYGDVHGSRPEAAMLAQSKQFALPLARLIETLKARGVYDRTLIAIYTTDGGRGIECESFGDRGKNAVVLAGGRIRGGYYGDIRIAANNGTSYTFSYHRPDANGVTMANGSTDNSGRVSGASVWKTVAKSLGIPAAVYNSYSDVQPAPELNFLLRA